MSADRSGANAAAGPFQELEACLIDAQLMAVLMRQHLKLVLGGPAADSAASDITRLQASLWRARYILERARAARRAGGEAAASPENAKASTPVSRPRALRATPPAAATSSPPVASPSPLPSAPPPAPAPSPPALGVPSPEWCQQVQAQAQMAWLAWMHAHAHQLCPPQAALPRTVFTGAGPTSLNTMHNGLFSFPYAGPSV